MALYAAHGKSRVVARSLAYGETDFTRGLLQRELQKLLDQSVCDGQVISVGQKPVAIATKADSLRDAQVIAPAAVPPIVPAASSDELRRQRSTWFAERDRLHAQLELVATDEQRRVMTMRILTLAAQIAASYEEQAGRTEPVPAAAPRPDLAAISDTGEIRRLLANLRPQASKLKYNPARAGDLAQARADILLLENKLKA